MTIQILFVFLITMMIYDITPMYVVAQCNGNQANSNPAGQTLTLFVTSTRFSGKLAVGNAPFAPGAGLAGADAKCQDTASRSTINAVKNNAKLFLAVLSTSGVNANARGWTQNQNVVNSNGQCLATNVGGGAGGLFSGNLNLGKGNGQNEILDESGNRATDVAWTGSTATGTVSAGNVNKCKTNNPVNVCTCNDWTDNGIFSAGEVGDPSGTGANNAAGKWLDTGNTAGCSIDTIFLLCLQGPAGGGVTGDPQFMGFQGQLFQVHGIPDSIFAIISHPTMQINANFAYLASGTCTYTNTPCWTHPGTYLDRIGMLLRCPMSGIETRVMAVAGSHSAGMTLSINGQTIDIIMNTTNTQQQVITLPGNNTIIVHDKDSFTLNTDIIQITFTNSHFFFNFQAALLRPSWLSAGSRAHIGAIPSVPLHGLLGQTWLYKKYQHGQYYEGDINDYLLETQSLFATDFTYSKYQHK